MNFRPLFFLSLLLLLTIPRAQAQDYMLLSGEYLGGAGLADTPSGTIPGDMQVSLSKFGAGYGVPINLGATQLTIGARYENLRIDLLDSDGFIVVTPDHLHYARLEVRVRQRLSDQWALVVGAAPGIASDFEEVGADDWRMQANLMLHRHASSDLLYGFGLAYTSDFGTPTVLPIAKLRWHSQGRLWFDGLLPLHAYLAYDLSSRSELGITAAVSGTQYNLNLSGDDIRFPNEAGEVDLPAKYSVITVGPTFKQRVRGPLFIALEAGVTVSRKLAFDGEAINATLDQDPSGYMRLGLAMRPNAR